MRNKILNLFLAMYMLTAFLPLPRLAAAENTEPVNLVRNGDFEDGTNMKTTWDNDLNTPYEVDENADGEIDGKLERVSNLPENKSGHALKFTTYAPNLNIWCQQRFFYGTIPYGASEFILKSNQFVPGASYRMSFKIYIDEVFDYNGEAMGLDYTFSSSKWDINYICGKGWVSWNEGTTSGRWTEVSGIVNAPAEAELLRILVRSYAKGTVYFDDITMEQLGAPEKFAYTTSHMFHYADENETGEATVSVTPFYQGTGLAETLSVNFSVYDGDALVTSQNGVKFINEEATFLYSPDEILKEKQKKYTLSVTVNDTSGKVGEFSQSLYLYNRPNYLDKDGNFRNKEGKVIDPFIAWGLRPDYYNEGARAGFKMTILPFSEAKLEYQESRDAYMAAAKEAGLYLIFGLCMNMKAAAHPDNIDNTKALVELYKDNPDFVGWIVQDEPLGGGVTEEAKQLLEESYTTIRNLDPNHPVILLDYNMSVFKETSKYCDIFMPNSYGRGYGDVRRYVEEAVKYSNGHPVWPNVAAYANGDGTIDKLPSGQQVQHFIYQAFLAGARGVSIYDFDKPVQKPKPIHLTKTPIWETLPDVGSAEVPMLFDLFVHGKEKPEEKETATYVQRKWTRDDGDYYILLSNSDVDTTVEMDIGGGKSVKVFGGDDLGDYNLKNGTLSVALEKNTIEGGKEKCFDIQMFKVYNTGEEPKVSWGGRAYIIAAYKETDGIKELIKVEWSNHREGPKDFVSDGDCIIKIFAWDALLKPLADMEMIPPASNSTVYK